MKARAGVRAALASGANPMAKGAVKAVKAQKITSTKTRVESTKAESTGTTNIAQIVKKFGGVVKTKPDQ
ncbi:MAG: hypothetical protein DRJ40_04855 [Thermoprotei archaeon]|nr:MAG: hypothetical protein DRJ40_04670 [Thermoprotei archaeon]RLE56731.1 MAG: hypothetical protein DRJ40_04855 [Thermoprotei archaeon]